MAADIIVADGLAQAFGDRTIFRDVSFTVATGEVFVILGGSGCGKSTLMRQLIGLLPPSAGSIILGGERITGAGADAGRRAAQRRIGVMFQSGALFGSMTLLENVMLPLEVFTDLPAEGRAAVARVKLELVGLGEAAALMPAEISGGMAKRAGIARALALDPPLLFLDEPSAGLDPVTSAGLDQLILDLRQDLGATFVVVTHELASILAIADRCVMLDRRAHRDPPRREAPHAGDVNGSDAAGEAPGRGDFAGRDDVRYAGGVIATGDPRQLRDSSTNPLVHGFFHRQAPRPEGRPRSPPDRRETLG